MIEGTFDEKGQLFFESRLSKWSIDFRVIDKFKI